MQKLMEAGLFGGGLTPVDTPELVRRYNECLRDLGIQPTSLSRFSVDGIGWSPEIAEERANNFYLSAGEANPMGVIVTPNQRKKPVYHPYNSYDRQMMEMYFERFHQAIADVTAIRYIGLDFDQELSSYESPRDLLMVEYVILRSLAGGLFAAAARQRTLVDRVLKEESAWHDSALRADIIASGKEWGDLRYRRIDIPDVRFDVGSFHTSAFGGAFVLRPQKGKALLVLEGSPDLPSASGNYKVMHISDKELPQRLHRAGLVETSFPWYARHPEVLSEKKEGIFVDVLTANDPELNYAVLNHTQKLQLVGKYHEKLPGAYMDLERFGKCLANGDYPDLATLPADFTTMLLRPQHKLAPEEKDVVWLLLCRLQPLDVFRLYVSDKNCFFAEYQKWPAAKQDWAINLIRENQKSRINHQ